MERTSHGETAAIARLRLPALPLLLVLLLLIAVDLGLVPLDVGLDLRREPFHFDGSSCCCSCMDSGGAFQSSGPRYSSKKAIMRR